MGRDRSSLVPPLLLSASVTRCAPTLVLTVESFGSVRAQTDKWPDWLSTKHQPFSPFDTVPIASRDYSLLNARHVVKKP